MTQGNGVASGYVGRAIPRLDALRKVTGRGRYASDAPADQALVVKILGSPHPHAVVKHVRVERALAMPGVEAVLTRLEMAAESLVFDERVRFCGDPVAAVAARSEAEALAALEAIEVEYEPLPPLYDPEEALAPGAQQLYPAYPGNIAEELHQAHGDVEQALRDSPVVLRRRYRTSRVPHANLETHVCIARVDADGIIDISSTMDGPYRARAEVAEMLGIDERSMRYHAFELSASARGARSHALPTVEPICILLARRVPGRAVRLHFTTEEEFICGSVRHPTVWDVEVGADRDGRLLGVRVRMVADHGSYRNFIARVVLKNACNRLPELYRIEHYRFDGYSVFTTNPDSSSFRGIGSTQLCMVFEACLDELARELGMDPVELRRRNIVHTGWVRPTDGRPIESCGLEECLSRGARAFGWETREQRRRQASRPWLRRGFGMGLGVHTTGLAPGNREIGAAGDRTQVLLRMLPGGWAELMAHIIDIGQGSETVLIQIAAHELGLPPERISMPAPSTARTPRDDQGTSGSRTTYLVGRAVQEAARRTRDEILRRAAEHLRQPASELQLRDGVIVSRRDPAVRLELGALPGLEQVVGYAEVASTHTPPSYGAAFAEVEVDLETGLTRVVRVVSAQDVGFAIHPRLVEGQVEGAVNDGVEHALYGELILRDGVAWNASFTDYHAVSMAEAPEIQAVLVESGEATGPYGAKGVGTPALPPIPAAIANAVADATGVRVREYPITPERLCSAWRSCSQPPVEEEALR